MILTFFVTVATIIWFFPVFKQYRDGFFYFFLVMAATEPISFFTKSIYGVRVIIYVYFTSMVFGTLTSFYYAKALNYKTLIFMIIILSPLFFLDAKGFFNYMPLLSGIILYNFSKIFYSESIKNNSFNLYYINLVIYQISSILKFQEPVYTKLYFFHSITILQTLIGFYFVFFNIKNSPKFDFKRRIKSV